MDIFWSADRSIRGKTASEDYFTTIAPFRTHSGGTGSLAVKKDSNTTHYTGATTSKGQAIAVVAPAGVSAEIENLSPTIASLSEGSLTPIQTGDVSVMVHSNAGDRLYATDVEVFSSASYDVVNSYVSGSLAKHIYDAIAAMISAKEPSAATTELFNSATYSTTAPAAVGNTGMFAASMDLSAISFTRTYNGGQGAWYFPAELMADSQNSRRFVFTANHVGAAIGDVLVFRRTDGSFQSATVLDAYHLPGTDLLVSFLSAAITGCNPMKILPDDWVSYIPVGILDGGVLPALMKGARLADGGADNRVRITYLYDFPETPSSSFVPAYHGSAENRPPTPFTDVMTAFNGWQLSILSGDSGSPSFLPINGQPVFVQLDFYTSYLNKTALIEAWMTSKLGSAVTLSRASLSMFNFYA